MFWATAIVVAFGLAVAALSAWILGLIVFGALPGTLVPGAAASGTKMTWLDPVKVALTVAAGIGGAVALVVAYRKQRMAERQELADVYVSAAQQLGHASPTVRLAGVYALASLADSWPEQRQRCVDVLCAHLRLPWDPEPDGDHPLAAKNVEVGDSTIKTVYAYPDERGELEVRRAILRAIGARLLPDGERPSDMPSWSTLTLDFTGAILPNLDWIGCLIPPKTKFGGVTFSEGAEFNRAVFVGVAWFVGVTFWKNAWFEGATFRGAAEFRGATFKGRAGFRNVVFDADAGFDRARFGQRAGFEDVKFGAGAWFDGVRFLGDARFDGAKVRESVRFNWAKFAKDARFDGLVVGGDAQFGKVVFGRNAWFDGVTFDGRAGFVEVSFEGQVWFVDAAFNGPTSFSNVAFGVGTWFSGATSSGAARFSGVTFGGPVGLEGTAGLDGAVRGQAPVTDGVAIKGPIAADTDVTEL